MNSDGSMMITKTELLSWKYIAKFPKFTGILIDRHGDKFWYKKGKCHRDEGPAVESADGDKWWFLHGKRMSKEEHKRRVRIKKLESFLSQEEG